jgi:hypothetical protein
MNRRDFVTSAFVCPVALSVAPWIAAHQKTFEMDLASIAERGGFKLFNRSLASIDDGRKRAVRLGENPGDGVAYLPETEFSDGTIECDIRGKDVPQQSFVGVAFHGVDGTTYDAIYFRPFNFRAADPARRIRAVQYISQLHLAEAEN